MLDTINEPGKHQAHNAVPEGESLGGLFAEACKRHGTRTAVTCGAESVTYSELNARAVRVASALEGLKMAPGAIVAIYLERSIDLVVAMLGVIQSGAAYLPIDASYPAARVLETLEDAGPVALITEVGLKATLGSVQMPLVLIKDLKDGSFATGRESTADDLAYVIYTSGSHGQAEGCHGDARQRYEVAE